MSTPIRSSGTGSSATVRRSEIQAWVKQRSEVLAPGDSRGRVPLGGDHLQGRGRRSADPGVAVREREAAEEGLAELVPLTRRGGRAAGRRDARALPGTDRVRRRHGAPPRRVLRSHGRPDRLPSSSGARRPPTPSTWSTAQPTFGPPKSQAGFRTVPDARGRGRRRERAPRAVRDGRRRARVHQHLRPSTTPKRVRHSVAPGCPQRPRFPSGRRSTTSATSTRRC